MSDYSRKEMGERLSRFVDAELLCTDPVDYASGLLDQARRAMVNVAIIDGALAANRIPVTDQAYAVWAASSERVILTVCTKMNMMRVAS